MKSQLINSNHAPVEMKCLGEVYNSISPVVPKCQMRNHVT